MNANYISSLRRYLAMWLWPPLMQKELDNFCYLSNNRRTRKQRDKILPSGVTPNYAYTCPERFGGHDCLQPVDVHIIDEILSDMCSEVSMLMDWGVPADFAARAKEVFAGLGVKEIKMDNVWLIFGAMLRYM